MSLRHGTQWGMVADRTDDWRDSANCRDEDPELFFPFGTDNGHEETAPIVRAKRICDQCQVSDQCLAWALSRREEWGIWGGHTAYERRRILRGGGSPSAAQKCSHGHERNETNVRYDRNGVEYCVPCRSNYGRMGLQRLQQRQAVMAR